MVSSAMYFSTLLRYHPHLVQLTVDRLTVDRLRALDKGSPRIGGMNSLILISPYKGSGFKPILSGKKTGYFSGGA
jgi:hypothetical protein